LGVLCIIEWSKYFQSSFFLIINAHHISEAKSDFKITGNKQTQQKILKLFEA
jgi:hypothetical protein